MPPLATLAPYCCRNQRRLPAHQGILAAPLAGPCWVLGRQHEWSTGTSDVADAERARLLRSASAP